MNPNTTIKVENLGLRFYKNPSYAFSAQGLYRSLFEKKYINQESSNVFRWIWKNLNFEIQQGDILAIMGANGEGKTTLLRVLAGLLYANEGTVTSRYKPFLLSTGLGFRDELNGYENIRLGCLFLGLHPNEIPGKLKQIAEFSELSHDNLEKPMRYYSDGMRARLVFSVATSCDQKILFLDEIIGAGDIGFQNKAKTRMHSLIQSAQTIVIVSHNKEFVLNTANKGLLLHNGKIIAHGAISEAVKEYERVCSHV